MEEVAERQRVKGEWLVGLVRRRPAETYCQRYPSGSRSNFASDEADCRRSSAGAKAGGSPPPCRVRRDASVCQSIHTDSAERARATQRIPPAGKQRSWRSPRVLAPGFGQDRVPARRAIERRNTIDPAAAVAPGPRADQLGGRHGHESSRSQRRSAWWTEVDPVGTRGLYDRQKRIFTSPARPRREVNPTSQVYGRGTGGDGRRGAQMTEAAGSSPSSIRRPAR